MAGNLHSALKSEKIASASAPGVDLILMKLQWSKNDVGLTVHAAPRSSKSADFLTRLGFRKGACAFLPGGDGYCCLVQGDLNLDSFSEAFAEAYKKWETAEHHIHACGFRLRRPWDYDEPPRNLGIGYSGDGHTAPKSKLMKNSEDQYFSFAFSWIEGANEQGWTTHYRPKHLPASSEMLATLGFLGLKIFDECPMFNFSPCFWKFTEYKQKGTSALDNNAEIAHGWFDAHATNFSEGVECLLAAQAVMESYGMYLLPLEEGQMERTNQEIGRKTHGGKLAPTKAGKVYEYDVALSFAGADRHLAETLAKIVRDAGFAVFYDDFFLEQLWGKDLVVFFDEIFRRNSRYCVIFISKEYLDRMWTNHERRSAQARALQERGNEYILPIQVDNSELPGLPATLGYLSLNQFNIGRIAEILIKKLSA